MRRLLILMVITLAASALTYGAPLCLVGDNALGAGFECSVGPITFSDFTVLGTGGYPLHPAFLTILGVSASDGVIQLDFAPNPAMTTAGQDMWFYMTITGWHMGVDLVNGGVGNTSIAERVCSGPLSGGACSGGSVELLTLLASSGQHPYGEYAAGPQSLAYVFKDIYVGTDGHLSSFSQSVHIPEPMTFVLIGSGLLALGLVRRRVRKS